MSRVEAHLSKDCLDLFAHCLPDYDLLCTAHQTREK
jgi:hypothetical protein